MALTNMQVRQLRAKLEPRHVKTRKANGADLHYVEGWHVIAESELKRARPNAKISAFIASEPLDHLFLSVVTFAEIQESEDRRLENWELVGGGACGAALWSPMVQISRSCGARTRMVTVALACGEGQKSLPHAWRSERLRCA